MVNENGALVLSQRHEFTQSIKMFAGKQVVITVEKKKHKRSTQQNNYYRGVIVPMVRDALRENGYEILTMNDAHEVCRALFLKCDIANNNGEFVTIIRSTTDLSTSEMMEYHAKIQQWAAEYLSINIPDPNQQLELSYE